MRCLLQHIVAAGMAKAVVDALEVVQIDHHHGQALGAARRPQARGRLFLEGGLVEQAGQRVLFQQRLQSRVDLADLAALEEDDRRAVRLCQRNGQRDDGGEGQVEHRPALQVAPRQQGEDRVAAHVTGDAQRRGHLDEDRQPQHRRHIDAHFPIRVAHEVVGVEADVPEEGKGDADVLYAQARHCLRPARTAADHEIDDRRQQKRAVHAEIDAVVERAQPRVRHEQHAGDVVRLHAEDHRCDDQQGEAVFLQGILPEGGQYLRGDAQKVPDLAAHGRFPFLSRSGGPRRNRRAFHYTGKTAV